ncbi:MAG: hypothetical protein H0V42_11435 [Nocardioidaceae bacterium]|nr:hypothetical protein [Nocardioidaceae bacterium]
MLGLSAGSRLGLIDWVASEYRLSRPVVVRMMGAVLGVAGAFVLLVGIGVALLRWPSGVLSTTVLTATFVVLAMSFLLSRRPTMVRLDQTGYVVRWVRGVGVARGRWQDVEDAAATTVAGDRCVVLRRRDGRTTTIPVAVIDVPADRFVQDLQQHLNRGQGYRPLG